MKTILFIFRSDWLKLFIWIVVSAVSGLMYTYSIKLLHGLINEPVQGVGSLFVFLAFISISSILALIVGHYLTEYFELKVSQMRVELADKVLNTNYELIERKVDEVIPVIQADVNTLGAFSKSIPEFIIASFKVIAILVYMCWLFWEIALVILCLLVLIFFISKILMPWYHREIKKTQKARNMTHFHLTALVLGIKELALSLQHRKGYVKNIIEPVTLLYSKHMTNQNSINLLLTKFTEFVVITVVGFLVFILKSKNTFEMSEFVDIMTLVLFILSPLIAVMKLSRGVRKVEVALEQIEEMGLTLGNQETSRKSVSLNENATSKSLIRINQVTYRYGGAQDSFVVGPFDFSIYQQEILIINGGNGSGKTTLAKLILGLYPAWQGEVSYKNQLINEDSLEDYRAHFSAVFTDSHVFENLQYLKGEMKTEKIQEYVSLLEIENKIELRDLLISNTNLSMGQKGRLNLLRALLEDKPVVLLDEWAANQDPYFREKFYCTIVPYLKSIGKTVILISHDDKYYHIADRIITLSSGIIESFSDAKNVKRLG